MPENVRRGWQAVAIFWSAASHNGIAEFQKHANNQTPYCRLPKRFEHLRQLTADGKHFRGADFPKLNEPLWNYEVARLKLQALGGEQLTVEIYESTYCGEDSNKYNSNEFAEAIQNWNLFCQLKDVHCRIKSLFQEETDPLAAEWRMQIMKEEGLTTRIKVILFGCTPTQPGGSGAAAASAAAGFGAGACAAAGEKEIKKQTNKLSSISNAAINGAPSLSASTESRAGDKKDSRKKHLASSSTSYAIMNAAATRKAKPTEQHSKHILSVGGSTSQADSLLLDYSAQMLSPPIRACRHRLPLPYRPVPILDEPRAFDWHQEMVSPEMKPPARRRVDVTDLPEELRPHGSVSARGHPPPQQGSPQPPPNSMSSQFRSDSSYSREIASAKEEESCFSWTCHGGQ